MGRARRGGGIVRVGGQFDTALVSRFGYLCKSKGVTMREGLRRCMVDAVLQNQVPGIEDMLLGPVDNAVERTVQQDVIQEERVKQRRRIAETEPEALENLPVHIPVPQMKAQKTRRKVAQVESPSKHTQPEAPR